MDINIERTECKHCDFINGLSKKIGENVDYWLLTEFFVYLHSGKDYCNVKKNNKECL
jgi:hypothetical protein